MSTFGKPVSARRPRAMPPPSYESEVPLRGLHVHAAAVYCSGGRVGEQIDEFLRHTLDTSPYDRLAVPGRPGVPEGQLTGSA